jgi:hypothetical protein
LGSTVDPEQALALTPVRDRYKWPETARPLQPISGLVVEEGRGCGGRRAPVAPRFRLKGTYPTQLFTSKAGINRDPGCTSSLVD